MFVEDQVLLDLWPYMFERLHFLTDFATYLMKKYPSIYTYKCTVLESLLHKWFIKRCIRDRVTYTTYETFHILNTFHECNSNIELSHVSYWACFF